MNKIKNNKIAIAIGTLSVITLMAIIYAAFTGQLNINGTANVRDSVWDIHIVESGQLEPSNTLSSSAKVLTKPTVSGLSISDFNLSLTTPGDYIEYTFHVINDGDYDATLTDLDKDGVVCTANGSTSDPEAIKVCNKLEYTLKYDNGSDVAEGDTLLSKQTQTMVLKIKYQEFNEPSLLPNTNVSISGLGIDISYSQNGNAKVNEDGTTPLRPTYSVGDEITVAGEQYYVIANSDSSKDFVTVLKATPLTATEVINAGGTTSDIGDSPGEMAYGSDSVYATSNIKSVIDEWARAKFTNGQLKIVDGYGARLMTKNEYDTMPSENIERDCCGGCGQCIINVTRPIYNWVYNSNYGYWTMTPYENSNEKVWKIVDDGSLFNDFTYQPGAVHPVINVYKSAIQNNS